METGEEKKENGRTETEGKKSVRGGKAIGETENGGEQRERHIFQGKKR